MGSLEEAYRELKRKASQPHQHPLADSLATAVSFLTDHSQLSGSACSLTTAAPAYTLLWACAAQ